MTIHQPIIETSRLILRKMELTDAPFFFELNSDPFVIQYTGNSAFKNLREAEEMVNMVNENFDKFGYGRLIVLLKDTKAPIGWCGLKYREETDLTDLGYRFMQKYWGQGYATEASLACINHGFKTLRLDRIIGNSSKANYASIAVLQKTGMVYFGETTIDNMASVTYHIKNN